MELKDGFKRMAGSGKYMYFNQGGYSVNKSDLTGSGRSIHYATAYNGGLNGKIFFMESGGNVQPDQGVTNPDTFKIRTDKYEDLTILANYETPVPVQVCWVNEGYNWGLIVGCFLSGAIVGAGAMVMTGRREQKKGYDI